MKQKTLTKITGIILNITIGILFLCVTCVGVKYFKREHKKGEELYQTTSLLYQLIQQESKDAYERDLFVIDQIVKVAKMMDEGAYGRDVQNLDVSMQLLSLIKEIHKKPSYQYLTSVTVRIFQEEYAGAEKGWIGTGSIIKVTDDYTYILTNKHVAPIENKDNIYVETDSKYVKAEVLKNGAFRDLSVIRISERLKDKQAVNGFSRAYPSDKVYSTGMYLANYYIYTEGTFAGYQEGFALINAPSSYGCSGSGVFDKDGNLVAVIFATNVLGILDSDSSKAICIRSSDIKMFLEGIIE